MISKLRSTFLMTIIYETGLQRMALVLVFGANVRWVRYRQHFRCCPPLPLRLSRYKYGWVSSSGSVVFVSITEIYIPTMKLVVSLEPLMNKCISNWSHFRLLSSICPWPCLRCSWLHLRLPLLPTQHPLLKLSRVCCWPSFSSSRDTWWDNICMEAAIRGLLRSHTTQDIETDNTHNSAMKTEIL